MRKAALVPSVVLAGMLSFLIATPAEAARQEGPSGSIELMSTEVAATTSVSAAPSEYAYGQSVAFETTIEGRVSAKSMVYVTVICMQGTDMVFQYSGAPDGSYPLADQAAFEWDGGSASCEAWLIYRVEKGKSAEITMLDMVPFNVVAS